MFRWIRQNLASFLGYVGLFIIAFIIIMFKSNLLWTGLVWLLRFPNLVWLSNYPPFVIGAFVTLLCWLSYLLIYEFSYHRWMKHVTDLKMDYESFGINIMKIWGMPVGHEKSMVDIGNLIVPTAFILLGAAGQPGISPSAKIVLSLAAPTLYLSWLFTMQLSTRLMNDAEIELRRNSSVWEYSSYAKFLGRFYGKRHGRFLVMVVRRNHWLAYLALLIWGSAFLIYSAVNACPCRLPVEPMQIIMRNLLLLV